MDERTGGVSSDEDRVIRLDMLEASFVWKSGARGSLPFDARQ